MPIAGTPLTMAAERASSAASMRRATSPRRIGTPSRTSTTSRSKSAGSRSRPVTRTSFSPGPSSSRPAGTSMFSRGQHAHHLVDGHGAGRESLGIELHRDRPLLAADERDLPDAVDRPRAPCGSSRRRGSSARAASACRSAAPARRSGCRRGRSAGPCGVSMSSGSCSRISSIFARTSCCASMSFTLSSNSMKIEESPSSEVEVSVPDPGDRVDRLLDLPRDVALHRFRRGARVDRLHHDEGEGDVRPLVDRQPPVREEAQRDQRQHQHGREDGPLDRDVGEEHRRLPPREPPRGHGGRRRCRRRRRAGSRTGAPSRSPGSTPVSSESPGATLADQLDDARLLVDEPGRDRDPLGAAVLQPVDDLLGPFRAAAPRPARSSRRPSTESTTRPLAKSPPTSRPSGFGIRV